MNVGCGGYIKEEGRIKSQLKATLSAGGTSKPAAKIILFNWKI